LAESAVEPIEQLRLSLAAVAALINAIRPDQWSAPTPCEQWDVHRVVEHLVGMNLVFAAMLAGEPLPERGKGPDRDDLARAFSDSATSLLAAFAEPGVLDRSYAGPLGTATGSDRLQIRLYDLLAHGWDLAAATGQPANLPDDAARDALGFVREQLTDDARAGRFAPPQPTPDGARPIEQLVAFLGRRITWTPAG
jgi:uncharacterized protein (TIGR03086 family)